MMASKKVANAWSSLDFGVTHGRVAPEEKE
jgi:hypothetical protein